MILAVRWHDECGVLSLVCFQNICVLFLIENVKTGTGGRGSILDGPKFAPLQYTLYMYTHTQVYTCVRTHM